MKTIRLTYDEACPNCKWVGESEIETCAKHGDELLRQIAIIHADGDIAAEEALYRLLVEGNE